MKHWTDGAMRFFAYLSILVFAYAAVVNAVAGSASNASGYVAAAGWAVIFLMWK